MCVSRRKGRGDETRTKEGGGEYFQQRDNDRLNLTYLGSDVLKASGQEPLSYRDLQRLVQNGFANGKKCLIF